MFQVVCVKVGTGFSAEYVNRLQRAVALHLTLPHDFACLTDDPKGIDCRTLPLIDTELQGYWQKVTLFGEHDYKSNRILYFDLDLILRGNIDEIVSVDAPFAILKDRCNYGVNSSMMLWDHDKFQYIWKEFKKPNHPWGDQGYIGDKTSGECLLNNIWPDLIVDYKEDLRHREPQGDERIVWFHGVPRPHTLEWVQELWKKQRSS